MKNIDLFLTLLNYAREGLAPPAHLAVLKPEGKPGAWRLAVRGPRFVGFGRVARVGPRTVALRFRARRTDGGKGPCPIELLPVIQEGRGRDATFSIATPRAFGEEFPQAWPELTAAAFPWRGRRARVKLEEIPSAGELRFYPRSGTVQGTVCVAFPPKGGKPTPAPRR